MIKIKETKIQKTQIIEGKSKSQLLYNLLHKYKVLGYKNNFQTNHPSLGKFGKSHFCSKKINQYTKQGEYIKTWDCMSDITRELGIYTSSISFCCKEKLKTAGGYIWKYI